jgi:hypothetical protein
MDKRKTRLIGEREKRSARMEGSGAGKWQLVVKNKKKCNKTKSIYTP